MTDGPFPDRPKILGDPAVRAARLRQLEQSHVAPLTEFVERIRRERGAAAQVPYFDPWDGGTGAEILFVLEAPGPKTVASGFVSRNNPDESASNFYRANVEARIPRERTVSWNVVPWALRDASGRVRAPNGRDLAAGIDYLEQLLALLPKVHATVLIGRTAERAMPRLTAARPGAKLFLAPHPSPQFVNRHPGNRERLTAALRVVAEYAGFDERHLREPV